MAEYIERKAVEKLIENGLNNPDKSKAFGHDAVEIMAEVHYMPAADVAPVVQGRWEEADWLEYDAQSCETILYPKAAIVCTNCRCAFKKDALRTRNYCPNCGAKMDGEP